MNINGLRAEIIRNGFTQGKVAEAIGMSNATFSRKLRRGVFGLNEAEKLIKLLKIENPSIVFFDQKVT